MKMPSNDTLKILHENLQSHIHSKMAKDLEKIAKEFIEGLLVGLKQAKHPISKEDEANAIKIIEEIQIIFKERVQPHTESFMKAIEKPLIELSLLTQKMTSKP